MCRAAHGHNHRSKVDHAQREGAPSDQDIGVFPEGGFELFEGESGAYRSDQTLETTL